MVKKVIVTGSSTGIGSSLSQHLLKKNIDVVGLARRQPVWADEYDTYHHFCIDFSKNDFEKDVKMIEKAHPSPDALVLCAGYGDFRECEQWSFADMSRMMQVNFLSQAWVIRSWLPYMKRANKGKIIIMGSECSLSGAKKASLYSASKFALRGFAQSIRAECSKSGIGVSLICPGLVATEFFDDLPFQPGPNTDQSLSVETVQETILMILNHQKPAVFDEIVLSPMRGTVESK